MLFSVDLFDFDWTYGILTQFSILDSFWYATIFALQRT